MIRLLSLMIRQILAMGATGITLASINSLNFKRGDRIQGTLTFRGVQHLEDCAMCGRAHIEECIKGTNSYFSCGKSGHMVKDFPKKRGHAGGNSKTRIN